MKLILKAASRNDIRIEKLEVMPDHVHAMISFRPSKSISEVVKALKGNTGYAFLRKHPEIREQECWGGTFMVIKLLHRDSWKHVKVYRRKIHQRPDLQRKKRPASPIHPPIKIGGIPGLPASELIIKRSDDLRAYSNDYHRDGVNATPKLSLSQTFQLLPRNAHQKSSCHNYSRRMESYEDQAYYYD